MNTSSGRRALILATITVVARDGLRALSNRSVAAEAKVSHGLVRHHFGTQDALIAEALDYAVGESLGKSGMLAPFDSLSRFAEGLDSLSGADADLQAFQYELVLESRRRPELRPIVARYYDTYRETIGARLGELGIDDPELVDIVWLTLDALVFRLLATGDGDASARTLDRVRALIGEFGRTPPT